MRRNWVGSTSGFTPRTLAQHRAHPSWMPSTGFFECAGSSTLMAVPSSLKTHTAATSGSILHFQFWRTSFLGRRLTSVVSARVTR